MIRCRGKRETHKTLDLTNKMEFYKSNPHPTGKKIGDCVIRAIVIAEEKEWIDVYKELCEIGAEIFDLPNTKPVYEAYLKKHGWEKQKMPKHENGKRMKLREFTDTTKHKLFIANVVKHIATIKNGELLDSWNCGHKCIGNYYIKLSI